MENKTTIAVNGERVEPGNSVEYRHEFDRQAHLTALDITTYSGQEFNLRYHVYILTADGSVRDLVTELSARRWIAGNADDYTLPCRLEVAEGDTLVIEIENVGAEYPYTANIRVGVDYGNSLLNTLKDLI